MSVIIRNNCMTIVYLFIPVARNFLLKPAFRIDATNNLYFVSFVCALPPEPV